VRVFPVIAILVMVILSGCIQREIPLPSPQVPSTVNDVADGILTITFVYFHWGEYPDAWRTDIDLDRMERTFDKIECPLIREYHFHDPVYLPILATTKEKMSLDIYYYWYQEYPDDAVMTFLASDVIVAIVDIKAEWEIPDISQGFATGYAKENWGGVVLGTNYLYKWRHREAYPDIYSNPVVMDELYNNIAMIIVHEIGHEFGAPDHYNPSQLGYEAPGTDMENCLYGYNQWNISSVVLCDYCKQFVHWREHYKTYIDWFFFG